MPPYSIVRKDTEAKSKERASCSGHQRGEPKSLGRSCLTPHTIPRLFRILLPSVFHLKPYPLRKPLGPGPQLAPASIKVYKAWNPKPKSKRAWQPRKPPPASAHSPTAPSLPPPRRLAAASSAHLATSTPQQEKTRRLRGFSTPTPTAAAGSAPRLHATVVRSLPARRLGNQTAGCWQAERPGNLRACESAARAGAPPS